MPVCSESFQHNFFFSLHNLSHPGANASIKLLKERYIWPCMKSDIQLWPRTCEQCQKAKVGRHTQTPVNHFPSPDEQFEHVHIDIIGPLPPSERLVWLFGFYGISTFVGCLTPNYFYANSQFYFKQFSLA